MRKPDPSNQYTHCPSVCVILAGYNEAENLEATIASIWHQYPRLEVIVVDDGSKDGMADEADRLARYYPGLRVLSKPERGGKASALEFRLSVHPS